MMLGPSRVLGSALTQILIWAGMDIKQARKCNKMSGWTSLVCPVVKTLHFNCREHGFNPWLGD